MSVYKKKDYCLKLIRGKWDSSINHCNIHKVRLEINITTLLRFHKYIQRK